MRVEQCLKFTEFPDVSCKNLFVVVFGSVQILDVRWLVFETDALSFADPEAVDFDLHSESDSLLQMRFGVKLSTFSKASADNRMTQFAQFERCDH